MEGNQCFVCADDCTNSYFYLINLASKKYKTRYTDLIGDLINSDYELRVTNENKICERCSVLLEKYDELQHETKTVKSVLGRQIAHTYSIETLEEMVFLDKSKTFIEIRPNANNSEMKYSCKLCPRYVTDNIDAVNAHIMFHKITTESQIQTNDLLRELSPVKKRMPAIGRESQKPIERVLVSREKTVEKRASPPPPIKQVKEGEQLDTGITYQQEYEEETLESLIDLELLEDSLSYCNLKNRQCMIAGCRNEFTYMCDYVRHLRFKHTSTLNHIFAVVRANIKRPSKVHRFMCPYCFTKTADSQSLEVHVKQHEDAGKSNLFTDRLNDFLSSVMASSRCNTCDYEIVDPEVTKCSHENAINDLVSKVDCSYCTRYFYSERLYNNHLAIDHGHCFICDATCADKIVLRDHIRSHLSHKEYSCPFCTNIYQTKHDRLDHMKQAHDQYCCTSCDEWYHTKGDLEIHTRYSHADKRMEESTPCICDSCGASFKDKTLLESHEKKEHIKRKIYTCSACKESFRFRYLLMEHISQVHRRTIVDNESSFYKCFICMQGFSSQNRNAFIRHLTDHSSSISFCYDCNTNLETIHQLEAHRERSHQDFSIFVDKKFSQHRKESQKSESKVTPKAKLTSPKRQISEKSEPVMEPYQQPEDNQFAHLEDDQQQQQIMVQTEDGSLLNMNNFILTENGELIIQNLDGLLPNGQESADDGAGGQIHISNLEQFLMEQGLSGSAEISYIQSDDNQVIIQNDDGTISQSSQGSLMQTYKEIFEPDENIPTELIVSAPDEATSQSMLLNGDYISMSLEQHSSNGQIAEQVEIQNSAQADANQSTLDELGDILLEVAAAAEKEKKPKVIEQKIVRESLWGSKKRPTDPVVNNGSAKKRTIITKSFPRRDLQETQSQPASNFSQAYEFFVKGFDAKKQKQL